MSTCCQQPERPVASTAALTIALAGNPNSGKTTIFNALTGLRQKVGNYPGVTVEKKTGRCRLPDGRWADIIDLPGTYSLISRSPDEQVAMEVLRGLRADTKMPDAVCVVVDASNLQRNLYLVSQLIEVGRPMVIALNMMDVAERRGVPVSADRLSAELGVPVIPVVGHKKKGIAELKAALAQAKVAPMPDWPLPEAMKEELLLVGGGLAILDGPEECECLARLRLRVAEPAHPRPLPTVAERRELPCEGDRCLDRYQAVAERLLIGDRAPDIEPVAQHEPVATLLDAAMRRMGQLGIDPMQSDIEAHYRWIDTVAAGAVMNVEELAAMGAAPVSASAGTLEYEPRRTLSDRIDAILIHKVWGMLIFAAIMGTLFVSIFWLAAPIMDAFSAGVGWLGGHVAGALPAGPIHDLVSDGIFAGVGAVVVFVPQIALLFLFLSVLEDSGYLARAAFLMDRALARTGLHGKSFVPLLSSFACAIPGIMATRVIEDRKSRLATIFVAPFMSCSARLPVYTLLIGTFFAAYGPLRQAGMMLSLYALGIVAAATTAWLFKRTLNRRGPLPAFILEMPSYKVPQLSQVARQVWTNTREFLLKAGTIIFCLSVLLWATMYYPRLPAERVAAIEAAGRADYQRAKVMVAEKRPAGFPGDTSIPYPRQGPWRFIPAFQPTLDQSGPGGATRVSGLIPVMYGEAAAGAVVQQEVAGEQLRYSFAGRFGHAIEPVIRPLGYDWKMGVGLVGAFAAREVFVSTMGIVYSVGDTEHAGTLNLSKAMQADVRPDGTPVWTPVVALSLLVWFVLAMQCMSTLAVVRRETRSWKWPLAMLLYMNALAYVVALLVYQVGSRLFA